MKAPIGGVRRTATDSNCLEWWRGAESNRRHYDFQSVKGETQNPAKVEQSPMSLVESSVSLITNSRQSYVVYEAIGTIPGTVQAFSVDEICSDHPPLVGTRRRRLPHHRGTS
jgi:hypothetical protein